MKVVICFAACILTLQCYAQNAESYSFKGNIRSKKTNEPVAFASVMIQNTQQGVIANENGEFEFHISQEFWGDTVEIDAIGFKTRGYLVRDLIKIPYNKIELMDSTTSLSAVVVTNMSAKDFLLKAFQNSGSTFPDKPYEMNCFYQSTLKENGKYVLLLQSLFGVFDRGFGDNKILEAVELEKGHVRRSIDYQRQDVRLQGPFFRPSWLLTGDNYVRNSKEMLENIRNSIYDVNYEDPEVLSGDMVYVITVKANEHVQKFLFDARFYIRARDFAFLRADFDGKRKIEYLHPTKIPSSMKVVAKEFKTTYIFKEFDHRMYMRYLNDFISYDNIAVPSGELLSSCEENTEATLKDYSFPPKGKPTFEIFPVRVWGGLVPTNYGEDKKEWERPIVKEIPFDPQIKIDLEKQMPLELQFMTKK
jgi:hypothetical protein